MDLTSKQRCGSLPRLCYRQLRRAGPKFVKKLTFNLGIDFRLKMCYPYIVREEEIENENIRNTEKGR